MGGQFHISHCHIHDFPQLTYFQDKLGMTHYLLIVEDNNTGKSNKLLGFSLLGYRPVLDGAITPANIYNILINIIVIVD